MYIVKVLANRTKKTRQLKQCYFKEFKTLQEVENYIAELNIGIPETNKYGNTTEIIGTKIFKEGK